MASKLVQDIRTRASDPMWADHVEVRKDYLQKVADRIEHLEFLAERYRIARAVLDDIENLIGGING